MSILSLSAENKDKLLQLIESLQEVFEKKDNLTEKSEPFVKRMNEITTEKENLDRKLEKYDATNFKSVADATDLSNIILKSKQLDEEIDAINASSRNLNIEFDEIINQENEIVSKIKELVELSSKNNEQIDESTFIETLGISVLVFRPEVPDIVSVVDRGSDEIINCEADIVKSLSEVYFENSIEITKKVDRDDFRKLEKYFLESKAQKEQSIDERLAFIQKDNSINSEEKTDVELVSEPVSLEVSKQNIAVEPINASINMDIPIQNQEIESVPSEEKTSVELVSEPVSLEVSKQNIAVEPINSSVNMDIPIQNQKIENVPSEEKSEISDTNILSLDSILQENKLGQEKSKDSDIIIIRDKFDNSHSKVANSNKQKLQNIINNFKGTFSLPIIKSETTQKIETKPIDPISSFINPKAA